MGFEAPGGNNYEEYKAEISKVYPTLGAALEGFSADEIQQIDAYVFNLRGSSFKVLTFEEPEIADNEAAIAGKMAELVAADAQADKLAVGQEIIGIIGNVM